MVFAVGRNSIQADLTGLRPFTVYIVRIAAFSSEDGNYTSPLFVKTWEGGKENYSTVCIVLHLGDSIVLPCAVLVLGR